MVQYEVHAMSGDQIVVNDQNFKFPSCFYRHLGTAGAKRVAFVRTIKQPERRKEALAYEIVQVGRASRFLGFSYREEFRLAAPYGVRPH